MKKIITSLMALAIAASSFAQVSVGVGYTNNSAKTTISSSESKGSENGFFVEGNYNIPLAGSFSLVPGVRYTFLAAGEVANIISGLISTDGSVKEHYIAIPVQAQYAFDLGSAKFLVFAGPTFNLGISSLTKMSGNVGGLSLSDAINNFKDTALSQTDVLVGGGIGLDLGKIQIKANFDLGLLDRNSNETITRKDATTHIGVYYKF